jgi:hypothetical protein
MNEKKFEFDFHREVNIDKLYSKVKCEVLKAKVRLSLEKLFVRGVSLLNPVKKLDMSNIWLKEEEIKTLDKFVKLLKAIKDRKDIPYEYIGRTDIYSVVRRYLGEEIAAIYANIHKYVLKHK